MGKRSRQEKAPIRQRRPNRVDFFLPPVIGINPPKAPVAESIRLPPATKEGSHGLVQKAEEGIHPRRTPRSGPRSYGRAGYSQGARRGSQGTKRRASPPPVRCCACGHYRPSGAAERGTEEH